MIRITRTALLLSLLAGILVWRPVLAGPAAQLRGATQSAEKDRAMEDMQKRQAQELNRKRQADLKRDTDKLLQLATELKLYVDKSNENVLSLNVIKKADEIEKLAKSVKEKMKAQ